MTFEFDTILKHHVFQKLKLIRKSKLSNLINTLMLRHEILFILLEIKMINFMVIFFFFFFFFFFFLCVCVCCVTFNNVYSVTSTYMVPYPLKF